MRRLSFVLVALALVACGRSRTYSYGDPALSLTPAEVDLGQALPGKSLTAELTLRNTSRVGVERIRAELSENLARSLYSVEDVPSSLGWGQSATIRVRYVGKLPPMVDRTLLMISSSAPGVSSALTAETLDPCKPENCGKSGDPCFGDGACVLGECVHPPLTGKACDDTNLCTVQDKCSAQGKCVGLMVGCDLPPPTVCITNSTLATYATGKCEAGVCRYDPKLEQCPFGCVNNKCFDPCAGVVCNQPPTGCHKPIGTCKAQLPVGVCSYELDDGKGCNDADPCTVNDRCLASVCKGEPMVCNTPPATRCVDPDNSEVWSKTGTCQAGVCQYTKRVDFCSIACLRTQCMSSCTVSLVAGTGLPGSTNGVGSSASFSSPYSIALDSVGTLFVSDTSNDQIRAIANGTVSTVPGTFALGGTHDVTTDGVGGLIVGSRGQVLRIFNGVKTVIAGTGTPTGPGVPYSDGPAPLATFGNETSVWAVSPTEVYITDGDNNRIRRLLNGQVTTFAGVPLPGLVNGPNQTAAFNYPHELFGYKGDLIISDAANHAVRRVGLTSGVTSTIAGTGQLGMINSAPLMSRFNQPLDTTVDPEGAFYLTDTSNNCIRRVSPTRVTTFAGVCQSSGSYLEGPAFMARFRGPAGIVASPSAVFYISDTDNHRIRQITCVP